MVKKRLLKEKAEKHKAVKEELEQQADKSNKRVKDIITNLLKPAVIMPAVIILVIISVILLKGAVTGYSTSGDQVKIRYTFQLEDGAVIEDGNDLFTVGEISQNFILASDKLDKEIMKIKEGEEKTIILEAKDAAGEYDSNKIETINRTREFNRTIDLPYSLERFEEQFNRTPKIGESLPFNSLWNATVLAFNNETITLKHELKEGQALPLPPDGNVIIHIKEKEDKIELIYNPGEKIAIGEEQTANVVDITDETFTIDYNSKYAGQRIIIKIKVLEIKKAEIVPMPVAEIPGAPVLDVFVMTYCPYGTQIEKGLIPVFELLGQKANIKVRFVSYTMHDEQADETGETKRQLCLREEQKDKFWPYLKCFLEAGNSAECLEKVKYDKSALTGCVLAKANEYWQVDKDLNTKYGVKGSPTVVLDGQQVNVDRDSESLKEAICDAFESSKPSECSEKLSTEAPSPGFGYGSSGSNNGNSCGA